MEDVHAACTCMRVCAHVRIWSRLPTLRVGAADTVVASPAAVLHLLAPLLELSGAHLVPAPLLLLLFLTALLLSLLRVAGQLRLRRQPQTEVLLCTLLRLLFLTSVLLLHQLLLTLLWTVIRGEMESDGW